MASSDLQRLVASGKVPTAAVQKAKCFEVLMRAEDSTEETILPFTPIIGLLGPLSQQSTLPTSTKSTKQEKTLRTDTETPQSLVFCCLSKVHLVPISQLFPVSECSCQYCLPCLLSSPSSADHTCPECHRCFSPSELAHFFN